MSLTLYQAQRPDAFLRKLNTRCITARTGKISIYYLGKNRHSAARGLSSFAAPVIIFIVYIGFRSKNVILQLVTFNRLCQDFSVVYPAGNVSVTCSTAPIIILIWEPSVPVWHSMTERSSSVPSIRWKTAISGINSKMICPGSENRRWAWE